MNIGGMPVSERYTLPTSFPTLSTVILHVAVHISSTLHRALSTIYLVWIEAPSACSKSERYHHGATSSGYTVPTVSFCHVNGITGLLMESRSRKRPVFMSLKDRSYGIDQFTVSLLQHGVPSLCQTNQNFTTANHLYLDRGLWA